MNVIFRFSIKHQSSVTYIYLNIFHQVSKFCTFLKLKVQTPIMTHRNLKEWKLSHFSTF